MCSNVASKMKLVYNNVVERYDLVIGYEEGKDRELVGFNEDAIVCEKLTIINQLGEVLIDGEEMVLDIFSDEGRRIDSEWLDGDIVILGRNKEFKIVNGKLFDIVKIKNGMREICSEERSECNVLGVHFKDNLGSIQGRIRSSYYVVYYEDYDIKEYTFIVDGNDIIIKDEYNNVFTLVGVVK